MDSMIQLTDVPNCFAQMFEGSDVSNQPRGLTVMTDISSTTLNRGNRIFLSIRWHKQDSMFSQSARAFNIFNPKPAVVRTPPRAISPYERELIQVTGFANVASLDAKWEDVPNMETNIAGCDIKNLSTQLWCFLWELLRLGCRKLARNCVSVNRDWASLVQYGLPPGRLSRLSILTQTRPDNLSSGESQ